MEGIEREEKTNIKAGWLYKSPRRKRLFRSWKKKYFVFSEIKTANATFLHLYYYNDKASFKARNVPQDFIDISDASHIGIGPDEINGYRHLIVIQVPGRDYYLSAASCEDMFHWSIVLRAYKFNDNSRLERTSKLRSLSTSNITLAPARRPNSTISSNSDPLAQSFLGGPDKFQQNAYFYEDIYNDTSFEDDNSISKDLQRLSESHDKLRGKYFYCKQCRKEMDKNKIIPEEVFKYEMPDSVTRRHEQSLSPLGSQGYTLTSNRWSCQDTLYETIPDVVRNFPRPNATNHMHLNKSSDFNSSEYVVANLNPSNEYMRMVRSTTERQRGENNETLGSSVARGSDSNVAVSTVFNEGTEHVSDSVSVQDVCLKQKINTSDKGFLSSSCVRNVLKCNSEEKGSELQANRLGYEQSRFPANAGPSRATQSKHVSPECRKVRPTQESASLRSINKLSRGRKALDFEFEEDMYGKSSTSADKCLKQFRFPQSDKQSEIRYGITNSNVFGGNRVSHDSIDSVYAATRLETGIQEEFGMESQTHMQKNSIEHSTKKRDVKPSNVFSGLNEGCHSTRRGNTASKNKGMIGFIVNV